MKKFYYKVKTKEGQNFSGIVEANNLKDAVRILRERNLIIITVNEKRSQKIFSSISLFQKVSSKDITAFTRQLSTMITAGLTLTEALSILKDQSKPSLASILAKIVEQIQGGDTFYSSLSAYPKVFSGTYLALVKSGEASGKLDTVLANLSDNLEKQEEFKGKIRGALIYPAIVITGMIVVAFIMMIYVVPKLSQMYEDFGTELPLPTKILIGTSRFVARFWFVVFAGIGGLVYLFNRWRNTSVGKMLIDQKMLQMPIIGKLNREVILTQITKTLSMLINAGVPIIESLNIIAETANNAVFEKSIRIAAKDVEKGLPLAVSLSRFDEYPPVLNQMVSVGEETGKLGEVLSRLSRHFELETEVAIKGLTSSIEPLMMVILGVGVGFLVISIITPIYQLTSQF